MGLTENMYWRVLNTFKYYRTKMNFEAKLYGTTEQRLIRYFAMRIHMHMLLR